MPTTFAMTTFYVVVGLNNVGQLASIPKEEIPSPYTSQMLVSLEACNFFLGRMQHPEKYTCQRFDSPKTTSWVYTPPGAITPAQAAPAEPEIKPDPTRLEGSHTSDSLGHTSIDKPEPPKEAPKQKKVAQQPHYERQAMFEGNPFSGLFNW
jgi:hypothetical protein